MKTRFVLALAMILLLLMAGSVSAAPSGAQVPFNTAITVQPTFAGWIVENGQQVGFKLDVNGYGDVMHLGASTWHADMWVRFGAPYSTLGADWVFTADNGDQLFGTYLGYGQLEGNINHCRADFWITGGTGRFEGASGGGKVEGWHPVDQSPGPLEFHGSLMKNVQ